MTSNQGNKQTLSPSTTRFFKVMTTTICQDEKLRIPNGFIRKHNNDMSSRMFLKTPDDKKWEMHITKDDEGFWFEKGWKEFATYYSLDHGYMIFFQYEGNSLFVIHIFGKNTFEIEYPFNENHHEQDNLVETSDDDSVEILDKSTSCKKKTRPKSPVSYPQPQKKKLRSDTSKDVGTSSKFHGFPKHHVQDDTSDSIEHQRAEHEHENEALNRARRFKSKNPSFMIVMKPSYLFSYFLHIPTKFTIDYMKKEQSEILLELVDGRIWDAKYCFGKIKVGWKKFVGDNELKNGDVCVFELVKSKTLTLKVLIFRLEESHFPSPQDQRDKDISGAESQPIILDKDEKVQRRTSLRTKTHVFMNEVQDKDDKDDKFNFKYPFFKVKITMNPRRHSRLILPMSFIRKYLDNKKEQIVMLKIGKKSWPVKLLCYSDRKSGEFARGWNQFWEESKLKGGDVCVFELIKKNKDALFQVHIFRGN
ncbi:unnamed protein product [Vicia faba]|uniref:TF-B3 domain-containing protein n=1 Tax=Vicia faba TaxID=3906 RepID=A0AAV0ZVF9_VICFA|nr:unnamed protein product [Vicia faba]